MDHLRKQIRDAAVMLLTGLPTTAARVYAGRTRPLAADHDPTLLIYMTEESSQIGAMGQPADLDRVVTLAIEGRVIGAEVPDDLLDTIAKEVEAAIGDAQTFGARANACTLAGTTITTQAPGASQAGEVRLEFRVEYTTPEGDPTTAA